MITRIATVDDLPKMESAAQKFYASSQYLRKFEISRFITLWATLLSNESGIIYLLILNEESPDKPPHEEIVGALGAVAYPDAYSDDLIATEFFWFIEEEHRGFGMKLYWLFEDWAIKKNCNRIRLTHLCDLMPDKLKWLYEEMGFNAIEINYEKELPL